MAWAAAGAIALVAAWLAISGAPFAHAAGSGPLTQKLSTSRARVSNLSGDVAAARGRVSKLDAGIASISGRLAAMQRDLNAKRAALLRARSQLSSAQAKLPQLEWIVATDQRVLARELVGGYEGARPDIVDVVLEATGFNDLLDRLAFAQRIGRQDARIVGSVKVARAAVSAQAIRLGALSQRSDQLAEQALSDRDQLAALRVRLVSQRLAAATTVSAKAGQLAGAKDQVAQLTGQLAKLQAAKPSSPPPSSSGGPKPPRGPVSHGFEFPMPKGDVSPPATWSLDDGVDIAAPGGTPELAVCSGTVVLHGIGGFGSSAPVLHCDSPLAGYDYVYYGHAGPGHWTPIGTHVAQGQVISQVGYGIVGISSGPHLEIGFADASGSPIGPSSAPAMMSLLRSAFGA